PGRGRRGHADRGRPRPARLRPHRAPLPRRAPHDHRRGHQRDPAADHLPEPARALRRAAGRADQPDDLPDEQRQLVLGVRQAVEKDVAPVIQDLDAGRRDLEPLVARLAELGLFGALAVPEHGGLGLPLATTALIVEEVARGSATLGAWLGGQLATTLAITRHAPREARDRLLPPMVRGERWTTPVIGPSIGARQAGSEWVLTGSAPVVAGAARAKLFLVNAALEDGRT